MNRWLKLLLCALAVTAVSCGSDSDDGGESGENNGGSGENGGSEKVEPIYNEISVVSKDCEATELFCDGMCVDVTSSAKHCGSCGNACGDNQLCYKSECKMINTVTCDQTLCSDGCVDINSDANNCGMCGNICGENMACQDGACVCEPETFDCDGDFSNGCESFDYCTCTVGQTQACYYGPDGTEGVGECKAGTRTCTLTEIGFHEYTDCEDSVLPITAISGLCTDKDNNCNGIPDGLEDADGDGFTICDGDLCDSSEQCNVENPELIIPGMLEVPGNEIDDDCDGLVDETDTNVTATPVSYTYNSSDLDSTARALAQAMDIVWECPKDGSICNYGLVSAKITRSSSSAVPDKRQVNVMSAMKDSSGTAKVIPQQGSTFAVLSTGEAKDVFSGVSKNDLQIEAIKSENKTSTGETQRVSSESVIPEIYSKAHAGKLQTHEACATGTVTPAIFDSVQLHLELKVPVNAKGFQFDFRFFSREYQEYVCSAFNDFFLTLLSTKHSELEKYPDHNIAFDRNGNPVSINNGFFTTCSKKPCSKDSDCPAFMKCEADNGVKYCMDGKDTCMDGAGAISAYYPEPYNGTTGRGGGTAWLTTKAPVVGGETITLDFYIWDTQDRQYDSTVLLDNFKWLVDETKVTTARADEEEVGPIL